MFTDALIMDKTWEVPGGFLAFSARFARTGVQLYDGSEIDPDGEHKLEDGSPRFKPGTLYPVDRPAEEVFSPRAMASFIAKPLTNDHPPDGVTIDDWSQKAKGVIGETLRDGEYARLSGLMTDKALIADYRAGKKELSGGYGAKLVIGDGVNAQGEAYVAKQTQIDGNHVAFVKRGRAGSECRVVDAAPCVPAPQPFIDSLPNLKTENPVPKTMLIDGLTVDVSNADTAEATIKTLIAARDAATAKVAEATAQVAAKDRELAEKDTKIADLEAKVADEATLDARADAKAELVTKGKSLLGDKMPDVKGKSLADTRRAIVLAVTGDQSLADKSDDYIEARFDGLKDAASNGTTPTISGSPVNVADAETALIDAQRKASEARRNAWKTPATAAVN